MSPVGGWDGSAQSCALCALWAKWAKCVSCVGKFRVVGIGQENSLPDMIQVPLWYVCPAAAIEKFALASLFASTSFELCASVEWKDRVREIQEPTRFQYYGFNACVRKLDYAE